MIPLLLAYTLAALLAPVLMRTMGRKGFLVLSLIPAATALWALAHTREVLAGNGPEIAIAWAPQIGMDLDFRLDGLSWLMTMLVGGIGFFVLAYCTWYFSHKATGLGRFAAIFIAFAGAMLGLVTTDNTVALYIFWELTTIFSYLLVGHYFERRGARRAALQALIVTTLGGLAMLGGIVILGEVPGGSYRLSVLVANPIPAGAGTVTAILVPVAIGLVLTGAITKSALVPFHFWLPGAMAAPTPVSAYLHAAAMVKAGVYLVARFAPAYSHLTTWRWLVLVLGGATMLLGGYRALRQHDLKLLLAFGTVSQLGFLILLVGHGDRAVALAGLALIGAHAMFKAALFLTVGAIDAAAGTRDLRELSGLGRRLPAATLPGVLAVVSMVGLPPAAGFVGKEAALAALLDSADPWRYGLLAVLTIGSILTFAYGVRFLWGAFATKEGVPGTPLTPEHWGLFVSPNVLAVGGIVAGLAPWVGERLFASYAATYPSGATGHLSLWAGVGVPLGLTAVIILGGGLLAHRHRRIEQWQAALPNIPDTDTGYRTLMRRLDRVSVAITARTQRGSLPLYLALILITTVVLMAGPLAVGGYWPSEVRLWDSPAQLVVAVVITAGAIMAVRARRRLKAAVLVGITGYGVVTLFALHGAPDLALTQALVETVTLIVFVLVLRRLPPYFSQRWLRGDRWWRILIAVGVAAVTVWFALVAPTMRVADPVSVDFPDETLYFGYGKNIVNVTLVDTRAWDTMGEISVLLAAATGIASLVYLRHRAGRVDRLEDLPARQFLRGIEHEPVAGLERPKEPVRPGRGRHWLAGSYSLPPQRRSVILEVTTRLIFHTAVLFSLFLLFSGHNAPGGGFSGGIVAGIALAIRYLAGGRYELGEAAPVHPGILLGTGMSLAAAAGLAPLALGQSILQSFMVSFTAPIFGEVHVVSTLVFDVGVYLVVVGLVLDILRSLGAEVDRQGEAAGHVAPEIAHDSPRTTAHDVKPPLLGVAVIDDAAAEEDRP